MVLEEKEETNDAEEEEKTTDAWQNRWKILRMPKMMNR